MNSTTVTTTTTTQDTLSQDLADAQRLMTELNQALDAALAQLERSLARLTRYLDRQGVAR
jgi:tetrahydromethanopterin S-methyltransferase subunit B